MAVTGFCYRRLPDPRAATSIAYSSSQETLRDYAMHATHFDVVVTDIIVPELDGPGLVRALRRLDPSEDCVDVGVPER